ncbi:AbrB family transcriptional regulator [Roseisalinus antarcticus]|uniref:Putative ammonia monooxygenase n=1 Tax=Roseisalinus antarcticus TaxID=254357 RepID=A0A1Y5SX84_9RHOB|nr:AbrB family transcriptional regulator [Roseisalinus antarcticus]SLN50208.1 Putative ammonia monooxygenase [Roseisalinus antarcticus]
MGFLRHLPDLPHDWPRYVLAIVIGAVGGAAFWALAMPLPWMLGAMLCTLVAVLFGAPLKGPAAVRPVVIVVIGVMLGSSFTPEVFADVGSWLWSLAFLLVYIAIAGAIVVPFYLRVGRMDATTAFFAAMPGGINDMMVIGEAMGGDGKRIVLAHAARVVITIGVIAVFFRVGLGLDVSGVVLGGGTTLRLTDIGLLFGCGVFGSVVGRLLRFPAPTLLGPMLLSASVHLLGWTAGAPPAWLVVVAQLLLGTIMGCRFLGTPPAVVARALVLSAGATLMALTLTLGFALALHGLFRQTVAQVLLAYAPGGLTEMSLVGLAMGGDVAYITVHHILRITVVIAAAPAILAVIARRLG